MSPTCCQALCLPLRPSSVRSAHPQVGALFMETPKGRPRGRMGPDTQVRGSHPGEAEGSPRVETSGGPCCRAASVPFGVKPDSATSFLGNKPGLSFPLPDHFSSLFFLPSSLFSLECPGAASPRVKGQAFTGPGWEGGPPRSGTGQVRESPGLSFGAGRPLPTKERTDAELRAPSSRT